MIGTSIFRNSLRGYSLFTLTLQYGGDMPAVDLFPRIFLADSFTQRESIIGSQATGNLTRHDLRVGIERKILGLPVGQFAQYRNVGTKDRNSGKARLQDRNAKSLLNTRQQ